jgi:hypothetical protein
MNECVACGRDAKPRPPLEGVYCDACFRAGLERLTKAVEMATRRTSTSEGLRPFSKKRRPT